MKKGDRMKPLCAALALALCACATQQRTDQLMERGPPPTDAQAEEAIRATIAQKLKDPDSVKQFRIRSGPMPVSWYQGLFAGGQYDTGWLFCFEYNAKNGVGADTGLTVDGIALRLDSHLRPYVVPVNWGMSDVHC
jgi:hypothetical protein